MKTIQIDHNQERESFWPTSSDYYRGKDTLNWDLKWVIISHLHKLKLKVTELL